MAEKTKTQTKRLPIRTGIERDNLDGTLPTSRTFQRVVDAAHACHNRTGASISFIIHTAMMRYLEQEGYLKPENGK